MPTMYLAQYGTMRFFFFSKLYFIIHIILYLSCLTLQYIMNIYIFNYGILLMDLQYAILWTAP